MKKPLVIVESPLSAETPEGVASNQGYARRCLLDSLRRGEAPLASHLLYTQVLIDVDAAERKLGIEAGLAWGQAATLTVVYTDRGISEGMELGIERAKSEGREVVFRSFGDAMGIDRVDLEREVSDAKQSAGEWRRVAEGMRDLAIEALGFLTLSDHQRAKAKLVDLCNSIPISDPERTRAILDRVMGRVEAKTIDETICFGTIPEEKVDARFMPKP